MILTSWSGNSRNMYLGSSEHCVVCPESQSCCLRGGLDDLEDPGKMGLRFLLLLPTEVALSFQPTVSSLFRITPKSWRQTHCCWNLWSWTQRKSSAHAALRELPVHPALCSAEGTWQGGQRVRRPLHLRGRNLLLLALRRRTTVDCHLPVTPLEHPRLLWGDRACCSEACRPLLRGSMLTMGTDKK